MAYGKSNLPPDEDGLELEIEIEEQPPQPSQKMGGADVAPTPLAQERERERHRLERELGRTAGGDGVLRDTRAAGVGRHQLDEAAREADRRVIGHDVLTRTANTAAPRPSQPARRAHGIMDHLRALFRRRSHA